MKNTLEDKARILKELRLIVKTSRLAGSYMHDVKRNDDGTSNFFNEKAEQMKRENIIYMEQFRLAHTMQQITTGYE
jgi:hypothetical protein